jgi:hypothetical protein
MYRVIYIPTPSWFDSYFEVGQTVSGNDIKEEATRYANAFWKHATKPSADVNFKTPEEYADFACNYWINSEGDFEKIE